VTSDEVRAAFLAFFEEKNHKVIPSSSLIPQGDPTLLLTTAGMVQFKPYFLGQAVPPNPRLASCQKCFRTTDIEEVGDPSHLTFFEMLGNFSIGDYFKEDAIKWAWEFVTERLGLPPQRLWISIFLDDDESFHYWRELGVPEQRILRLGEKDNFWGPAGDSGPCGPCSEILYDLGEEVGCQKPSCDPSCECGRFSEIWNLVFTQYNQDKEGHRTLLPRPNIDTGMGLERTAAVMQGKTSVYDTDLFVPLIERIADLADKKYDAGDDTGNAMRIIAEHGRGIAFLIGDGVIPGNEGRGYVLRRLLRRAALFGQKLGLDKPFLAEIAEITIEHMKHVYPELGQRRDFIIKVIELEEPRFDETLSTGLERIEGVMAEREAGKAAEISGKDAFRLYDTYGFPVELTTEIAAERGLSVDLAGFNREMQKQRERAKATQKFGGTLEVAGLHDQLNIEETPFVGYHSLEHKSVIISLLVNGTSVETIEKGREASLILETTPFYAEMGGQTGDTGEIFGQSGRFSVTNTIRVPTDIIVHQGRITEGVLSVGDEVTAEVDKERRLDIARNHTATHLLQSALRQVLGEHVQQRGSLVAPDRLRFDFAHLTAMTKEEIQKVNHIVNEKIRQDLAVYDEDVPYKKAIDSGVIAIFDEKYGDVVRALKIGRPLVSAELCGGTHVAATGEIGFFHIIGESSIGAGLRRIEAVTGRVAEAFIGKHLLDLESIAQSLESSTEAAPAKVHSLLSELDKERRRTLALEREIGRIIASDLLIKGEMVNGIKLIAAEVPSSRIEALREMGDYLREEMKSGIIVLGSVYNDKPIFLAAVTPDLVARGYDAGKIVREVAKVAGGGGGGKASLAQAGGKHKDKLDEALQLVKSLI
jgi:alanyl-tRNA synthetase